MQRNYLVLVLAVCATIGRSAPPQQNENSKEEVAQKMHSLYLGPPVHYVPNHFSAGVDPQFQFNYVPNRQYYPNGHPVIIYGAPGVPPGQQPFLYRPVSPPPGNFLIPQPGPGVFGHPPTPLPGGFPKPAHIPPIEKDAEEVPDLAGNHPPTRTGRPNTKFEGRPEKLETFDEVESNDEANDMERGRLPDVFYSKRGLPNRPVLRPGQQFFILNGNTLFSNIPLEEQPNFQHAYQRSSAQGIEHQQAQTVPPAPIPVESENYVAVNNFADFKRDFLLRQPGQQELQTPCVVPNAAVKDVRQGKHFDFNPFVAPVSPYSGPIVYPYVIAFDLSRKEDDDTVTIEAKPESDKEKKVEEPTPVIAAEEPSVSQAKPSSLAISGAGGVASAGSRGTALVGNKGVAVASPEATAVAGPSKDEPLRQSKPRRGKEGMN